MQETKHLPTGRAAGTRGSADHLWGGHWRAVVFVGGLAGIARYGDAVVAPLHQDTLRPDLNRPHPAARHEQKIDHGGLFEEKAFNAGSI